MKTEIPLNRYRSTRVKDGYGGYTEVLGNAKVIYGFIRVDQNETILVTKKLTDVKVDDIIEYERNE